ncbi:MAG: hypothetical protein M5U07_10440 [Xanthobacteraceae bacterium]|nr:hypothetical protein [Xanthobacteraceae bacterium]
MADRRTLGLLGFFFGGVTAAVILMAAFVVKQHVDGRLSLEGQRLPVIAAASQPILR